MNKVMQVSTRSSLKATQFVVSSVWLEESAWNAGSERQPPGTFIRLSPEVPEFESAHGAVGLLAILSTGAQIPYTLARREESGCIVLFVPGSGPSGVAVGGGVSFVES